MRALILAAGLGERMRPLSALRAKPALPVRGIPVVAHLLALLERHDVREVVINLHHLPDTLRDAVEAWCPDGMRVEFSHEPALLGTGGAIRRVRSFLAGSDPSLILAGDMLLDGDLGALIERHRKREGAVTLLLKEDPRAERFGTIGIDAEGVIRRIGRGFDLGGSVRAGIYVHATVISPRALEWLPELERIEQHRQWLAPALVEGHRDIRGELGHDWVWEPIGTPAEYLRANLEPPRLTQWDCDAVARARGVRIDPGRILGRRARIGDDAVLERVVVWDDEKVPDGFQARDGVFAGGRFHACPHWSEARP